MAREDGNQNSEAPLDSGDEGLRGFERAERARRLKLGALVLVGFVAVAGVFIVAVLLRGEIFDSGVDTDEIDRSIQEQTNDPYCRDMIAQVGQLGEDFFKIEPTIDEQLLGDDRPAIEGVRDDMMRLQQRLDEISEGSSRANLRYDESRKQLDEWFDFVAVELGFLDRLANERLAQLKTDESADESTGDSAQHNENTQPKENAESGADSESEAAQEAEKTDTAEGVVVAGAKDDQQADADQDTEASAKTPLERKQGALLAVHESFQKFRIWHTAGAHPCGAAPEGVEPWRSEAGDKAGE